MSNLKNTSILLLILTIILIVCAITLGLKLKKEKVAREIILRSELNDLRNRTQILEAEPKTVTLERNVTQEQIDSITNNIREEFLKYERVADCVSIDNGTNIVLSCNPVKG